MDAQRKIIEAFKRDLPAILEGCDSTSDADCCGRCGMHFKTRDHAGGSLGEKTVCAERGCSRWFMHGMNRSMTVTIYKI